MIVIRSIEEKRKKELIATVGFFDGVHAGHRYLLREMQRLAGERGLSTAVFTFPVHPRITLQEDYRPQLLNSFDEKLKLLESTGIDFCVVLDFTLELAFCTAYDFIVKILSEQWHVRSLLIGHDHRFGNNRTDGFDEYVEYGKACGMEIVQASSYNRCGSAVSSSQIRQLLSECWVEDAAMLLTYPYRLKGKVVYGTQIGRVLGFPTANIAVNEPYKVWPGQGVYAVWVYVCNGRYKGMLTIGDRPTMNGTQMSIEVHILHFSHDIYYRNIEVEFMCYLRDNRKFENPEALIKQLKQDRLQIETLLK